MVGDTNVKYIYEYRPDPSASSPSSTSDGLVGLGGRQTRDAHEVPSEEEDDDDDDDEWGGEPYVGVDVG